MAATLTAHSDELLDTAGIKTQVRRGGQGAPLLFIHGELGVPGWLECYQRLSEDHDVIVPSLPGYGGSQRPDWIMSVHDLAAWVTWFVRDSSIRTPLNVVGCSMGGWIAAEIATIAPQFFNKMVLVGPMGIKPNQGEIFDYFLEGGMTGLRHSFHKPDQSPEFARFWGKTLSQDEQELIEQHREMTCRVVWKPYMHSLTLSALLPAISTPALVIQGSEDRITPLACGEMYRRGIKDARAAIITDCGHMPEMEQPTEFVQRVQSFLAEP